MSLATTANIRHGFNGVTFNQTFDSTPNAAVTAQKAHFQAQYNTGEIQQKLNTIGQVLGNEKKPGDNGQGNAITKLPGNMLRTVLSTAASIAFPALGFPLAVADGINFVAQQSPKAHEPTQFTEYKKNSHGRMEAMPTHYTDAFGDTWGPDGFKVQPTAKNILPQHMDPLRAPGMHDFGGDMEERALRKMQATLADQLQDNGKLEASAQKFGHDHNIAGMKGGPKPPTGMGIASPMPGMG